MSDPNAAVAHGGGPTAVINASLAGLIETYREGGGVLWGARFGVSGLLAADFIDLTGQAPANVQQVAAAPGSAIGSSRKKLEDADYDRIFETLRLRDIRWLFYTGGNGSMGTALEIDRRARAAGFELQVIGIPKTIDNDLAVTDHSPGYASTARFFACAARDIGEDNRSLPPPISILEVLGRNAGWVVAATSLARRGGNEDDSPHLIYLPERPVALDRIAADVERVYRRLGRVFIAVCEGQRDERGTVFGADVDQQGSATHALASNLGHTLARAVSMKLGLRARAEKPGLLGRSCGLFATKVDREEAWQCGRAAVEAARKGESGVMVAIRREPGPVYRSALFLTRLENVARVEKLLPESWIAPEGNDITDAFRQWALPLTGEIQPWRSWL